MSRTYVTMEVSSTTYMEVHDILMAAGYEHAINRADNAIDMHGLALVHTGSKRDASEEILLETVQQPASLETLKARLAAEFAELNRRTEAGSRFGGASDQYLDDRIRVLQDAIKEKERLQNDYL